MSTFFGHWPLIPEGYFDIDLPRDNLEALTVTPYILTPFTDRIFHMKLARFLTAFMSPPSWQHDRIDSIVIADFTQRFQQVMIDQLPPVFWMENPDKSWDGIDAAIPGKREMLHLFIWATKASLYKAFADPCNSLQQQNSPTLKHGSDLLALSHRRTLMTTSCKVIATIARLYMLIGDEEGGGAGEKLFLLPTSLVEALSNLGVCLLSIQADEKSLVMDGIQFHSDPDLRNYYLAFLDGFNLLCQYAPQQAIAGKGVKILESLHETLKATYHNADMLDAQKNQQLAAGSFGGQAYPTGRFQLEHALVSRHTQGGASVQRGPFFPLPAWLPSYLASPGRSWLFHDPSAFADVLA